MEAAKAKYELGKGFKLRVTRTGKVNILCRGAIVFLSKAEASALHATLHDLAEAGQLAENDQ